MNTPLRPLVRNDYPNFESTQHRDVHHHSDYANYQRPFNEVHHVALHGWGIAYGLEIRFQAVDVLNVSPGVAIDSLGRMIVLAPAAQQGHWTPEAPDDANRVEPSEVRNLPVALTLNQEQVNASDQYLTIQYAEVKYDEGSVDRIEVVPSLRLQSKESVATDGTVVVLATIQADGSLSPADRQLIGQSTGGLTIQHSASVSDTVTEVAAGTIGPGDNGGLAITVPHADDVVMVGTTDLPVQLRVNGSMAIGDEVIIDSEGKWIGDKAGLQGEDGKDGRNGKDGQRGPGITVVQVVTGAPGTKATARLEKITGDAEGDQSLHLQIPQGEKGAPGPSGSSSWVDGKKSVSTDANVGIGTDEPKAALHVIGPIQADVPVDWKNNVGRDGIYDEFIAGQWPGRNWRDESDRELRIQSATSGGAPNQYILFNGHIANYKEVAGQKALLEVVHGAWGRFIGLEFHDGGGLTFLVTGEERSEGGTRDKTKNTIRPKRALTIERSGKVVIGKTDPNPEHKLDVEGVIRYEGLQQSSSKALKTNIHALSAQTASEVLAGLTPVTFDRKSNTDGDLCLGFIAEDVHELVASRDRQAVIYDHIVAVLTQTVKEQQRRLTEILEKIGSLESMLASNSLTPQVDK